MEREKREREKERKREEGTGAVDKEGSGGGGAAAEDQQIHGSVTLCRAVASRRTAPIPTGIKYDDHAGGREEYKCAGKGWGGWSEEE